MRMRHSFFLIFSLIFASCSDFVSEKCGVSDESADLWFLTEDNGAEIPDNGRDVEGAVYSCYESFLVYSGCTTDKWYGKSPYLKENSEGELCLTITDELLARHKIEE